MRSLVTMACTECKQRNLSTTKTKRRSDRIELNKYLQVLQKNTLYIKKLNNFC